jgi:hypothetical protein
MQLVGANPTAQVTGVEELPGKANYFLGNDPKRWRSNIATYGRVKYRDIYPGIDLVYYGRQQQLEYDILVAPGADPTSIRMSFEGADKLEVDPQGNLVLHTACDKVIQHAPRIYQESHGTQQTVSGRYVLLGAESPGRNTEPATTTPQQVGFEVGGYDRSRPLVIDPVLVYSTYLGGSGNDSANSVAVDRAGNAYLTGGTQSPDFPTANPLQPALVGDAFVAKLNAAGTALVYSTFLGGSGNDGGSSIAVDRAGNAYVTGGTGSPDFPTKNPLQPVIGGFPCGEFGCPSDAFVAKLNPAGTALIYSTFLGGSGIEDGSRSGDDFGSSITADAAGYAYVTGTTGSGDFPTVNPLQPNLNGSQDAFVAKLNVDGSALVYSTYLGGQPQDEIDLDSGSSVAVDPTGNAYVTGRTDSSDFPTANPLQPVLIGRCKFGPFPPENCPDAFVAKLNPAGTALVYSTFLGGSSSDQGSGIAVDSAGNAYVTGDTGSSDFPTKNPLQPAYAGGGDAFVAKLNPAGTALVYSTFLGGSGSEGPFIFREFGPGIAVDPAGNASVTGGTSSPDFPTVSPLQPAFGGGTCGSDPVTLPCPDAFVAKLNVAGTVLVFSTYLGGSGSEGGLFSARLGIALDTAGNTYVTGTTTSSDLPTANPFQPTYGGGGDAFVAKIASGALPVSIDIKPGGSPNSINPRSNGNIPVAVVTTKSFDASSVDPSTVRFGRTGKEAALLHSSLEDVDRDVDLDLVLHFATQQTGILCGDSSARLTGKTFDGQPIEGSDSIRTVDCR